MGMDFFSRMLGGHHGRRHGQYRDHDRDHNTPRDCDSRPNPYPAAAARAGVACPGCRAVNASGARFCQQCGISFTPVACVSCAATLPSSAKFCPQCGQATA